MFRDFAIGSGTGSGSGNSAQSLSVLQQEATRLLTGMDGDEGEALALQLVRQLHRHCQQQGVGIWVRVGR